MKFFGWGKSKDPQPQSVLQRAAIKPDARNGPTHGPLADCCKTLPGMGSIMPSGKGTATEIRKKQELFGDVDDNEGIYFQSTSASNMSKASIQDDTDYDEKLQDKIRFVFSHEQEGLLAIGTFALEQLQSMRNTIDGHEKAELDDSTEQSSDDEDQLQRRWLAARKTCDLPVFGDSTPGTPGADDSESDRSTSKALALYNPHHQDRKPNPGANAKSMVLLNALPPELRRALDPASALLYGKSFLPHWTDAVPPPILAKPPAPFADEDYYSSRLCGLFSKKKSEKSKRPQNQGAIVPVPGDEKKRMIPIELAAQGAKKSLLKFAAPGVPTLGKLAKLWRASCKQPIARIVPDRKPHPAKKLPAPDQAYVASEEVFSTSAPPQAMRPASASNAKVAEFRKRQQEQERMASLNAPRQLRDGVAGSSRRSECGHWIKDDEDYFVLEM